MPRLDENGPCITRRRRGVVSNRPGFKLDIPVDDSLYINAEKCVQAK
jgi:hypothetical protein